MPVFEISADSPVRGAPEGSDSGDLVDKLQDVPRAMAYYDAPRFSLPSSQLRLRLARRLQAKRPRRNNTAAAHHHASDDPADQSTVDRATPAVAPLDSSSPLPSSIHSKVRRQRLVKRSHSLYSRPGESQRSEAEIETETDLVDAAAAHSISDKRIFVRTEITISESLELDLAPDRSHIPRLVTRISGPEVGNAVSGSRLSSGEPISEPHPSPTAFVESISRQFNDGGPSRPSSSPSSSSQTPSADDETGGSGRGAAVLGVRTPTTTSTRRWTKRRWSIASQPTLSSSTATTRCSSRHRENEGSSSSLSPTPAPSASRLGSEVAGTTDEEHATQSKPGTRTRFRFRIPDFLRPLDEPLPPTRTYDLVLRRDLFSRAQPGNEVPLTTVQNGSRKAQAKAVRASEAGLARSGSCPVLPPFT
ncbi:hypothetical protein PV08_09519 [Exophiala spinifera]|uniref:Uncharacterized protein n=1 Tax=Exophiala spinifera TaxID=91928 RepID=A0A0D2AZT3_9EURO|nr:uncharacterized protein PV08_09519 [Exophiala spinifera]KIW12243.1 hypothetical protein PV08_09519 [Exophiala spinifera]